MKASFNLYTIDLTYDQAQQENTPSRDDQLRVSSQILELNTTHPKPQFHTPFLTKPNRSSSLKNERVM
jgi:hypothetical protein